MQNVKEAIAENSFKPGYMQIDPKKRLYAKIEIMNGLNITSEGAWHRRLNGEISPTLDEVIIINNVLAGFGVTKNIWTKNTRSK